LFSFNGSLSSLLSFFSFLKSLEFSLSSQFFSDLSLFDSWVLGEGINPVFSLFNEFLLLFLFLVDLFQVSFEGSGIWRFLHFISILFFNFWLVLLWLDEVMEVVSNSIEGNLFDLLFLINVGESLLEIFNLFNIVSHWLSFLLDSLFS
jgi:hypothetical protein